MAKKSTTIDLKFWLWIAVILFVSVVSFYIRLDLPQFRASLMINFPDDIKRQFEGKVEPGMSILEALQSSSLGGNFEVVYTLKPNGSVSLASIGQVSENNGGKWNFYLNGKPVFTRDLYRIKIKAGDFIEAKYGN